MEAHLPAFFQFALYAGCVGVAALLVVSLFAFLLVRREVRRIAQVVEDLRVSVVPLAGETRMMIQEVSAAGRRVHEQWVELEGTVDAVRLLARQASHLASMATPATLAAGPGRRILNEGIRAFAQAFLSRSVNRQRKARAL